MATAAQSMAVRAATAFLAGAVAVALPAREAWLLPLLGLEPLLREAARPARARRVERLKEDHRVERLKDATCT